MKGPAVEELARRSRGLCEARLEGCSRWGTAIHHRLLRKHGGPDTVENGLVVCSNCHTDSPAAIHRNPKASYEAGFLVHSYSAEADALRGVAVKGEQG